MRAARPLGQGRLLAGLTAFTLLAVAACGPATTDPRPAASASSPAASASSPASLGLVAGATLPDGMGAGSTGESGTPGGSGSSFDSDCLPTVGALLRERTTVGPTGLVTVLPGELPCAFIGLWTGRFTFDSDPAIDPAPQFGARYTGARQLAVRIPPVAGRCTAAAVFFTVDVDETGDRAAATQVAAAVRAELAGWPAGSTALVPGGGILRGRNSPVLAATVVGDPGACSPGESVSTPMAAVGDCWIGLPDTGPAIPAAAADVAEGTTRFRRTTCGEPHTHEVYWAESLSTKQYLAEGQHARLAAATWARQRADEVCARRGTRLDLTHDVPRGEIFLEFLWPATLAYPPSGPADWSKAQIVCLARWQDGRASTRHLLHR